MRLWSFLAAALLLDAPLSATTPCRLPAIDAQQSIQLKRFLAKSYYTPDYAEAVRNYARSFPDYKRTQALRFSAASIPGTDLTVAYVSGTPFCGSGGCTVLMLRKTAHSFDILGEEELVFGPVILLPTRRAGYPELGVWKRGYPDGGHEVAISFDGRRYKLRETRYIARDGQHPIGKILIGDNDKGCPVP